MGRVASEARRVGKYWAGVLRGRICDSEFEPYFPTLAAPRPVPPHYGEGNVSQSKVIGRVAVSRRSRMKAAHISDHDPRCLAAARDVRRCGFGVWLMGVAPPSEALRHQP